MKLSALGLGNRRTEDDMDISKPSSASNVLHVSHSDGSVSTIVRQLEAKLQESPRSHAALPKESSSMQTAEDQPGIPLPPPSPNTNPQLKKSIKRLSKKKKAKDSQPTTELVMSSPSNFQHNMHVDTELNWGTDPQKVLKLGAVLGQGAYGQVVEAQYINTNYVMALKIIPIFAAGKGVEEVSREINVLRRCRHPNIVSYYGSATTQSELWIMMEYCAHGSVGSVVDAFKAMDRQFTEKQLAHILHQALMGLTYLHNDQIKVIHRDLKCGNILVGEDGSVKLADFGISFQQTGSRSKAATMIGTPLFMAPEMLAGDPYNSKADIWSLGITAIEMADGVPPFIKDHQMRALYRIMHEDPPTLAEPQKWSSQFVSFIAACLQKEPADRPTASALLEHEFLKQVKPEETKAVMRNLLSQYEDARRELKKRRNEKGDMCLNFGVCGGNLTTLSTTTLSEPPSDTGGSSRRAGGCTGLTTESPEYEAAVIQLRSSSSAPTLTSHIRNNSTGSAETAVRGALTSGGEYDEEDMEYTLSAGEEENAGEGAEEGEEDGGKKNKKESKTSSTESGATDGEEGVSKKSKRKSEKKKKGEDSRKKKPGIRKSLERRKSSSPPSSSSGDRRSTLVQMHGGQSSMAFFTGLSRGAQQLLSGAPQAPPPPPPGVLEEDDPPPTLEEHLHEEVASTVAADQQPPRTMAELARVVDDLDTYLAMPLIQLIFELDSLKKKQALLTDDARTSSK